MVRKTPVKRRPGNPKWIKGCESPNQAGRPPGLDDIRNTWNKQVTDEVRERLIKRLIHFAESKDPDIALEAFRIMGARLMPAANKHEVDQMLAMIDIRKKEAEIKVLEEAPAALKAIKERLEYDD